MTNTCRALLATAAGATLALGAPPLRLWPTTFVAAALFALSVDGASARRAFLAGWLTGTVATLGAFYWIIGTVTRFTNLPLVAALLAYLLLAALAGVALGAAGALSTMARSVLGQPLALALAVLVAERYAPSIFPWQFAAPLIYAPWFPQMADLVGVSGVSAFVVGTMAVFARTAWLRVFARRGNEGALAAPARWHLVLAGVLFATAWGYGALASARAASAASSAPIVRVALVQPAIPATVRWNEQNHPHILAELQRLTEQAARHDPALIVWSEGAYPYPLAHRPAIDGEFGPPVFPRVGIPPIVVGALTRDEAQEQVYNAALLRHSDGSLSQPVAKQVLVPFGEYIPLVGGMAWVQRIFSLAGGISHGTEPEVLRTRSGLKLGVLNCFEDTMAILGAGVADTDLLINITNDAWFGDGAGPWQHLMLAQWRAIETRRELLRAVNTGVTVRVDVLGRVAEHVPQSMPTALVVDARRLALRPLAPHVIPVAPPLALAVLGMAGGVHLRRRIRERKMS